MLSIFNQPTPLYSDIKTNLVRYFWVGAFIAFFLIFFQPFGTANANIPNKNLFLSGYGIITFVVFASIFIGFPRLFPKLINEEQWVVWKQLALFLVALSITFLVCYGYQATWFGWRKSFRGFWGFYSTVFPISLFPAVIVTMLDYIYQLKKHQNFANNYNQQIKPKITNNTNQIELKDENGKVDFQLHYDQLVFIKAASNYVEINYLEGEKIKKYLLRNSIKNIAHQLTDPPVKRCHRSYLVNMEKVGRITGNAQGYKLHFPFTAEFVVPVSRSKGKELLNILRVLLLVLCPFL